MYVGFLFVDFQNPTTFEILDQISFCCMHWHPKVERSIKISLSFHQGGILQSCVKIMRLQITTDRGERYVFMNYLVWSSCHIILVAAKCNQDPITTSGGQ